MKVGIIDGTGNISIVRLLLKQGHEVVCFNRAIGVALFMARMLNEVHTRLMVWWVAKEEIAYGRMMTVAG